MVNSTMTETCSAVLVAAELQQRWRRTNRRRKSIPRSSSSCREGSITQRGVSCGRYDYILAFFKIFHTLSTKCLCSSRYTTWLRTVRLKQLHILHLSSKRLCRWMGWLEQRTQNSLSQQKWNKVGIVVHGCIQHLNMLCNLFISRRQITHQLQNFTSKFLALIFNTQLN